MGGIAIALAAQKTLENVIGGISIIVDDVVHVGKSLKVGDTMGDVEDIGLRSTRIRTLDRTVVSVPNGLIANLSPENLSRDKFWLHNFVGLRYDTTPSQMGIVVASFEALLVRYPLVEPHLSACVSSDLGRPRWIWRYSPTFSLETTLTSSRSK